MKAFVTSIPKLLIIVHRNRDPAETWFANMLMPPAPRICASVSTTPLWTGIIDGARCATDEDARKRLVEYIHTHIRELLSNYGKIDILWYDVAWPLDAAGWR